MKYLLMMFLSFNNYASVLTYTEDAKPIFKKRCATCHNERTLLPNFLKYDEAYKYRKAILRAISSRQMPHFIGEQMTESERDTIIEWIRQGAAE